MEIVQGISVTRISEYVSQFSEFLEEFGVLAVIAFKLQTKLRTISNHKTTTHLRRKRQFIRTWAVSIFHQRTIKWIELDEWPFWLLTKASVDSFGIDLDYAVWKRQLAYPAIKSPVVTRDLGWEKLTEVGGWWSNLWTECFNSPKSGHNPERMWVFPKMVVPPKHPKSWSFLVGTPWLLGTTILGNPPACHPDGLGEGSRIGRSAGRRLRERWCEISTWRGGRNV